tara:strand:- start:555 stop:2348 length:1794 start_codon:yes stop_codon:yes gene_type:complete
MAKKKLPIKYTSRDFETIKGDLIEFSKRYYPETFQDFSEASFGALMLDTVAYVGDVLSFYLDYQVNESFLDTAAEYNNVLRISRQLGYKDAGAPSSTGVATFYIVIPANTAGLGADTQYLPILKRGSTFNSATGTSFILTEDVDFAHPSVEQVVASVNTATGNPITYALRANATLVSGIQKTETFQIAEYKRFRKVALGLPNVSEVISVMDADGNEYYEVNYLSQDVIYKDAINRSSDRTMVPRIMRPYSVPRRFVVERSGDLTYLQFGYGSDAETAVASPVDPANVVLKQFGKDYLTETNFDPSKLIASEKFGVVPSETTLTVKYRSNSTGDVNVSAGSLNQVGRALFSFENLRSLIPGQIQNIKNSLEVFNSEPILGDVRLPTSEEVRRRTIDFFATQNRAVTKEDYEALIYSMPPKFGAIKRCLVRPDPDSFKRNLNIYILAENTNGKLATAPQTLKNNLKTWLNNNKMINDTIDIVDAYVINLGITFKVLSDPDYNRFDVLNQCQMALETKYRDSLLIGEPLYLTDIYYILNNILGVVDTTNVAIVNKTGGTYSNISFNITDAMSADGRYIMAPDNVAFEILNPSFDITGEIR